FDDEDIDELGLPFDVTDQAVLTQLFGNATAFAFYGDDMDSFGGQYIARGGEADTIESLLDVFKEAFTANDPWGLDDDPFGSDDPFGTDDDPWADEPWDVDEDDPFGDDADDPFADDAAFNSAKPFDNNDDPFADDDDDPCGLDDDDPFGSDDPFGTDDDPFGTDDPFATDPFGGFEFDFDATQDGDFALVTFGEAEAQGELSSHANYDDALLNLDEAF